MKRTPAQLRQDAALIRKNAAQALVHAEQMERDAQRLEEEQEAKAVANAELAGLWFRYSAKLRRAH